MVLMILGAVLFCYGLAVLLGLLVPETGEEVAASVFYRLDVLVPTGLFLAYAS